MTLEYEALISGIESSAAAIRRAVGDPLEQTESGGRDGMVARPGRRLPGAMRAARAA